MPEIVSTCSICGASDFQPVEHFESSHIRTTYCACSGCGLVVMNPRPTLHELEQYYAGEYWEVRDGDDDVKRDKQRRRCRYIISFLERISLPSLLASRTAPHKVLEIGSSFGMTLLDVGAWLESKGIPVDLFGIEPSDHAVISSRHAYHRIHRIGVDQKDLKKINEQFDLVILSHVLEHLNDPVDALATIRSRLSPRGALFVEVPNFYGHPSLEYAHTYCFTETSLRNCLHRAGLKAEVLDVNGHDESFPFYLTAIAMPQPAFCGVVREDIQRILAQRAASQAAFRDLRKKTPRPN